MNEDLRIAINRGKYYKNQVIQYRRRNNSIYQGSINYIDVRSIDEFKTKHGSDVHDVKLIEDFREGV